MGKDYQEIDERISGWVERQQMFFVATAPLDASGLVNCSPKGLDSFRILGPKQVAYADTGGSGIETVAHLKENGRIVIMFCAFSGPPKIFRFYGKGRAVEPHEPEFEALKSQFADLPAIRNFIVIDVERIRDSCGYGVPNYQFAGNRESLPNWIDKHGEKSLLQYRIDNNETSLDGLHGLELEPIRRQLE